MIERIYSVKDVSSMTLPEVEDFIDKEGIDYCGDFGFEVRDITRLKFSMN